MNKIKKFSEYSLIFEMIDNLIISLTTINEKSNYKSNIFSKHKDKLLSEYDIDMSVLGKFSDKLNMFIPVVSKLIENSNKIDCDEEESVMASICTFYVICLEHESYSGKNEEKLTQISKNLLEELKLRGIGNGVIKKIIKSLQSIKDLISFIFSQNDKNIDTFSKLIEIDNLEKMLKAVFDVIEKNNIDFNNCPNEFLNIIGGIGSVISKEGMDKIIKSIGSDEINSGEILKNLKPKKVNKFDINSPNGVMSDVKNTEIIQEQ